MYNYTYLFNRERARVTTERSRLNRERARVTTERPIEVYWPSRRAKYRHLPIPVAIAALIISIIIAIIYYGCKHSKRSRRRSSRENPVTFGPQDSLQNEPTPALAYPMGPCQYPPGIQYPPGPNTYPTGAPYPTQPPGNVWATEYPQGNAFNQTYSHDGKTSPAIDSNQVPPTMHDISVKPTETKTCPYPISNFSNQHATTLPPSNLIGTTHPRLSSNPPYIAAAYPATIQGPQHQPGIALHQDTSGPYQTLGTNTYPTPYSTIAWPTNGSEGPPPSGGAVAPLMNIGGVQESKYPEVAGVDRTLPVSNPTIPPKTTGVSNNDATPTSYPSPYSTIPLSTSVPETLPFSSIDSASSEAKSSVPVSAKINPTE